MMLAAMKPEEVDLSRGGELAVVSMGGVRQFSGDTYECRALICPEEEGGFSVYALRLPGVVSQGETEEEALANLAEAFQGVIQEYRASGMSIPWGDAGVERVAGCKERWIVVDV